jgi:NADPH-dependent glutamate synthase beta subunit-like oxidoreductase
MPVTVAIVGAGPSGFYAAAALVKSGLDCSVHFIEALPTPFGLIRGGVAPDHQSTKGVARAFAKTAGHERIGYFGNVRLGQDVSLPELRDIFDAVVIALGAPMDRELAVPGGDKAGAFGAAAFVGWYNGHPDFIDLNPDLNVERVCVIGNGNVALDVARVLAKTPDEMASSDLPDYAAAAIHRAPIREIVLIGRRGPAEAKFTNKELSELNDLAACVPLADAADLPDVVPSNLSGRAQRLAEKNLETFRLFSKRAADERPKALRFQFYAKPVEVLGADRVEGLRLERTEVRLGRAVGTGETFDIPCGLIVSAIGYRMAPVKGLPIDPDSQVVHNRDGRVEPGLYVVGWAKRGPTGVIGSNKVDGDLVADQIAEDLGDGGKPGAPALEALLRRRGVTWVTFDDWLRIEAAEIAAAPPGAPRRKLIRIKDMLAVLGQDADDAQPRVTERRTL